ncbi:unnamed protein product [Protopolystoma xenopodis]|uniref:Secreted protein n=1 Tax=Protopolystoma xenopodis TaxID=117903 RepID=A0A448WXV3_9PLAT|nr:unnamed protein product [Protopolystoma xenopodis]
MWTLAWLVMSISGVIVSAGQIGISARQRRSAHLLIGASPAGGHVQDASEMRAIAAAVCVAHCLKDCTAKLEQAAVKGQRVSLYSCRDSTRGGRVQICMSLVAVWLWANGGNTLGKW